MDWYFFVIVYLIYVFLKSDSDVEYELIDMKLDGE